MLILWELYTIGTNDVFIVIFIYKFSLNIYKHFTNNLYVDKGMYNNFWQTNTTLHGGFGKNFLEYRHAKLCEIEIIIHKKLVYIKIKIKIVIKKLVYIKNLNKNYY